MFITPKSKIAGSDPSLRHDCSSLGNNQSDPAGCPGSEMNQVPVICIAFSCRILTHGGSDYPVFQGDSLYPERREKF